MRPGKKWLNGKSKRPKTILEFSLTHKKWIVGARLKKVQTKHRRYDWNRPRTIYINVYIYICVSVWEMHNPKINAFAYTTATNQKKQTNKQIHYRNFNECKLHSYWFSFIFLASNLTKKFHRILRNVWQHNLPSQYPYESHVYICWFVIYLGFLTQFAHRMHRFLMCVYKSKLKKTHHSHISLT